MSVLVAPQAASRLWGSAPDDIPTASRLLRSMGYRDALVGALLLRAGLGAGGDPARWFLASAGADLADLVGGLANHDRLPARSAPALARNQRAGSPPAPRPARSSSAPTRASR